MKKRVLFLCTGNACRSQMAEGWLKHLGGDDFEVFSAGIEAHGKNPRAITVMCSHADAHCPVFSIKGKREHWPFEDPAKVQGSEEEIMDEFRKVRDQIRARIEVFLNAS